MPRITKFDKKLGKRIQKLRKKRELSQEELAETLNISRVHMGYIEQGRRKSSIKTAQKLSRVFGISLSELFRV